MTDYIKEAKACLEPDENGIVTSERSEASRSLALTAIAEQLRIANLIALTQTDSETSNLFKAGYQGLFNSDARHQGFRSEILEALGIKEES